jgi:polysaccharide deacetylase family protein (PEP-CTERM system associated)
VEAICGLPVTEDDGMEATAQRPCLNAFSCELEDWFHILDSDRAPRLEEWPRLPLQAERNVRRLLELFDRTGVRATFFCLGWMAERMPRLVRDCEKAGHEIGSHGYGHVLAYRVGRPAFLQDIVRSKAILEDITGHEVVGFRCPGFAIREECRWVFEAVTQAGYRYDASVFPASHGHGGLRHTLVGPHLVTTPSGPLVEIPVSTVSCWGRRFCLFGGGHLRISPLPVIRWGIRQLRKKGQPLVVYIHPREIDPDHPRLPLRPLRRFKCYVNLRSTMPKVEWLCRSHTFTTMCDIASTIRPMSGENEAARPAGKARPAVLSVAASKRPAARNEVPVR